MVNRVNCDIFEDYVMTIFDELSSYEFPSNVVIIRATDNDFESFSIIQLGFCYLGHRFSQALKNLYSMEKHSWNMCW